jgi:hypothetical protein
MSKQTKDKQRAAEDARKTHQQLTQYEIALYIQSLNLNWDGWLQRERGNK